TNPGSGRSEASFVPGVNQSPGPVAVGAAPRQMEPVAIPVGQRVGEADGAAQHGELHPDRVAGVGSEREVVEEGPEGGQIPRWIGRRGRHLASPADAPPRQIGDREPSTLSVSVRNIPFSRISTIDPALSESIKDAMYSLVPSGTWMTIT